jgi:thymidylate synthase
VIVISAGSASDLFSQACQAVLSVGLEVAPRDTATVEVLGAHLCLTDPRRRLVDVPPMRVLNPAYAAAEAVWVLSGSGEPWIYQYNRRLANFADDGLVTAYGPRLRRWRGEVDQLDEVRRLLIREPETRRAVIQMFDPGHGLGSRAGVPCALGYRFFLRGGRLHMHTTMRSQDLWLGFGYDLFTATVLQELLAGWVGAEVGEYHHHVDSLHLYEHDVSAARRIASPTAGPRHGDAMAALAVPWADFDTTLRGVITGRRLVDQAWAELAAVLCSYRLRTAGDRPGGRIAATDADGPLARALDRWYDHLERARPHVATETRR